MAETVGVEPEVVIETIVGVDVAFVPLELVTRTVYDPGLVTVIERVVCPPGLHKYCEPLLAVNTTDPPEQKLNGPLALIVAVAVVVFGI